MLRDDSEANYMLNNQFYEDEVQHLTLRLMVSGQLQREYYFLCVHMNATSALWYMKYIYRGTYSCWGSVVHRVCIALQPLMKAVVNEQHDGH